MDKRKWSGVAAFVIFVVVAPSLALAQRTGSRSFDLINNSTLTVKSGSSIVIESGGTFTNSGTQTVGTLTLENGESLNCGTDATFDFTRNTAGTVTITCSDDDSTCAVVYDAGGAASVTLGSIDVTQLMAIVDNDMVLRNGATGVVSFDLRDYADTTDDDMAHAIITLNCTDTGSGTEDCDLTIGVVEGGAAAETRFSLDADGGATIGSANTDSFTVTTDGTGTGEVVLPLQSIAAGEIVNDTIDGTELADTITLDAALVLTGAVAINVGNSLATAVTIATDGTGTGELVLPSESVAAGEITNLTRTANIPIFSMIECTTDAGALIGFDATADALPDFACSATDGLGCSLTFDGTGGSVDTAKACGALVVPDDYASGGAFVFRVTKDAETGANTEVINVQISNDAAALEAAGTATVTTNTIAEYTVTPTIAGLAAGESVGFTVSITSGGTADDTVNIWSIGFEYTAVQ